MRREATWPEIELYGPGHAAIWGSLYEKFGLDFASSLDLTQLVEHGTSLAYEDEDGRGSTLEPHTRRRGDHVGYVEVAIGRLYRLLKRSTRPVASISFCLPV